MSALLNSINYARMSTYMHGHSRRLTNKLPNPSILACYSCPINDTRLTVAENYIRLEYYVQKAMDINCVFTTTNGFYQIKMHSFHRFLFLRFSDAYHRTCTDSKINHSLFSLASGYRVVSIHTHIHKWLNIYGM